MTDNKRRWLVIGFVGIIITAATLHYLRFVQPSQNVGPLALQRLTLLNLDQPAPGLESLKLKTLPAVIVFCESCELPDKVDFQLIQSSNKDLARQYGLISKSGEVGPGYIVVDRDGQVRYATFDTELHKHAGEINRIVRGTE